MNIQRRNMHLAITAKHIEEGDVASERLCPIALAIKQAKLGTDLEKLAVTVYDDTAYVFDDEDEQGDIWSAALPQHAINFIEALDNGDPTAPFECDLTLENSDYL